MSINIVLIADSHLCVEARRTNVFTLLNRKPWEKLDVVLPEAISGKPNKFSFHRPTSYSEQPLIDAADFIERLSGELDLIIHLGDLSTTGIDEDLAVAEQVFLDNKVTEHIDAALRPRFGGLGIPLHIVPGNHDRYFDDHATPGCRKFDDVFRKIYEPIDGVCTTSMTKDEISLGVVSADFCFAAGAQLGIRRYGRGAVDRTVLSQLEFQTRRWQRANPNKPVIWALHFSPAEGVSTFLRLEERELVTDLARKMDVKHIFCGHTHLRKREIGTHPHIYYAGSVSSIDSVNNHFLHICTVRKAGDGFELDVHDFKYDEDEEQFVLSPVSRVA